MSLGAIDQAKNAKETLEVEELEIDLLLEAIYQCYGYDFRNYSRASVVRRVRNRVITKGLQHVAELIPLIIRSHKEFQELLNDLTINVTEMFRDPTFYQAFRKEVVPILKTFPFFKVWHAGCSTGEEVYSMAILLHEEGLLDRAQVYATDIDKNVLEHAKKGIYSAESVKIFAENYRRAGGQSDLSDYYVEKYERVIFDPFLSKGVVFADHDLVTDQVFGEMQVVICRNVIIYFNKELQQRVFRLFADSLDMGGFLCLGTKESLKFSDCIEEFGTVDPHLKIYQKRSEKK